MISQSPMFYNRTINEERPGKGLSLSLYHKPEYIEFVFFLNNHVCGHAVTGCLGCFLA